MKIINVLNELSIMFILKNNNSKNELIARKKKCYKNNIQCGGRE